MNTDPFSWGDIDTLRVSREIDAATITVLYRALALACAEIVKLRSS